MMSRILLIALAAGLLFASQDLVAATGSSMLEPAIACVITLVMYPWLRRQFE